MRAFARSLYGLRGVKCRTVRDCRTIRLVRSVGSYSDAQSATPDPRTLAHRSEKLAELENVSFRERMRRIPVDQRILNGLRSIRLGRTQNKQYKGDQRDFVRKKRALLSKNLDIKPKLLKSCASWEAFPREKSDSSNVEIAFVGRSNVGKSSLLNVLAGTSIVAAVSDKPGETQSFNFYRMPSGFPTLVDMPGYGFAFTSNSSKETTWSRSIDAYICNRKALRTVYVLVDGRHGLKPSDLAFCEKLNEAKRRFAVVLTKGDLVDQKQLAKMIWYVREQIRPMTYADIDVFPLSSKTLSGVPELQSRAFRMKGEGRAKGE